LLVLVADRDPAEREALKAGLDAGDCQVVTATDGPVIVNLAMQRSPDAVVVSSSLGRMGGFAVSRELKTLAAIGRIPEPKVVVLLDRDADAWLAGWAQCDAWRTKPVDAAEIDQLVRELVGSPVARPT
jgi:CheY-like chemotaxis protein